MTPLLAFGRLFTSQGGEIDFHERESFRPYNLLMEVLTNYRVTSLHDKLCYPCFGKIKHITSYHKIVLEHYRQLPVKGVRFFFFEKLFREDINKV